MVTPTFQPIKGGAETVVQNLSTALSMIGVHVDIMTFNMDQLWHPKWSGRTEKFGSATVYKIPALDWLPIVHSPRINFGINLIPGRFRHVMREYDVLHFHQAEYSFPLFSFSVKRPKILHLHGLRLNYYKRYWLSRMLLRKTANIYLSLSLQMKKDLISLGISEDKIIHFPNTVDTKIYCPKEEKTSNTILYVGRITPDKGLHVLLRSLKYAKNSLSLKIIGPISDFDLNYYRIISSMIKKENMIGRHKIEYLGVVTREELLNCYQDASIFVLPSLYEPFGVVILEAMSCGTPVIATNVGGVPEIIGNCKNGILLPSNDHVSLAAAIDYLMENGDLRVSLGKTAREYVIENYSTENLTKVLCTIYERLSISQTRELN